MVRSRILGVVRMAGLAFVLSLATAAFAHHGWSGFDQDRPLFLQGTARKVAWRNPHAEFDLELPADLALPADLVKRTVPADTAHRGSETLAPCSAMCSRTTCRSRARGATTASSSTARP